MEQQPPARPPPKHISPPGMWASKLTLRIISLVFCIALIGLGGSLASTGIVSVLPFAIMGPPVFAALIWDIAEGICILARGGHRGIHPGANVGVDLLLWLALTACTVILWLIGIASSFLYVYCDSYYDYDYNYYRDDCDNLGYNLNELIGKGRAILGLAAVLTILHFVTFVIACYETNLRNRRGTTNIVYMYTTTTTTPGGMPQHGGQQYAMPQTYSVAAPAQVYYPHQQQQQQQPMYYTYATQSPPTTTTTPTPMTNTAATSPQMNHQSVIFPQKTEQQSQPTPPPPIYDTRMPENKNELPS
ncbi:hypothetical protein B0H66DRAFT_592929 [Apodospora peruviana]|uniref:Uncharacterized protein n=1 Tax=Apodospora peruviana TaxID=516989 RepID=A0AAE0M3Q3_9PEZI|nr:hypothetical protein B0H66DRAFT_592929 [Apodospora peruviana]